MLGLGKSWVQVSRFRFNKGLGLNNIEGARGSH